MKRLFILAASIFVLATSLYAQSASIGAQEGSDSYADRTTQDITLEDKYAELHPKARTVNLSISYTPLTGEVRFYYTCMAASFDQGEAMNTAMAVFEDFAEENRYKHYTYRAKDKTKYFKDGRDVRMATYESYVLFTR